MKESKRIIVLVLLLFCFDSNANTETKYSPVNIGVIGERCSSFTKKYETLLASLSDGAIYDINLIKQYKREVAFISHFIIASYPELRGMDLNNVAYQVSAVCQGLKSRNDIDYYPIQIAPNISPDNRLQTIFKEDRTFNDEQSIKEIVKTFAIYNSNNLILESNSGDWSENFNKILLNLAYDDVLNHGNRKDIQRLLEEGEKQEINPTLQDAFNAFIFGRVSRDFPPSFSESGVSLSKEVYIASKNMVSIYQEVFPMAEKFSERPLYDVLEIFYSSRVDTKLFKEPIN